MFLIMIIFLFILHFPTIVLFNLRLFNDPVQVHKLYNIEWDWKMVMTG
jgi:hypothetical protein